VKNLTFITGAARSGKSLLAEELASKSGKPVVYLATMQIFEEDPEQVRRLELHRRRRPSQWKTIEAPFAAEKIILNLPEENSFVVFDCLSLYVTNMLIATAGGGGDISDPYEKEAEIFASVRDLLDAMLARTSIEFVIVSNEVGWGVVPETPLGRAFRDFLGVSNQMAAAAADRAFLSCAGLRVQLK